MYQKVIGTYETEDGKESGIINGFSDDGFSKVKVAVINGVINKSVIREHTNRNSFKHTIKNIIEFELGNASVNFRNGWK